MNHSDRIEILSEIDTNPLGVGDTKVVFFYTNGKKYTATNVTQLCFDGVGSIEYTTLVENSSPVYSISATDYRIETKDVSKVEVHTANGTIVTTYRVR